MAKLSPEFNDAMRAAYDIAASYGSRVRPSACRNPYLWSSYMWEAWELGDYIHEKGLTLGAPGHWERGRGNTYRNADGLTLKLHYGKSGPFGITRIA